MATRVVVAGGGHAGADTGRTPTPNCDRRLCLSGASSVSEEYLERTGMENELSHGVDALPGLVWTALPDGCVDFLNQPIAKELLRNKLYKC
jgi:hypothetical protein